MVKIDEKEISSDSDLPAPPDRFVGVSGSMSARRSRLRPLSLHIGQAFDPFGFKEVSQSPEDQEAENVQGTKRYEGKIETIKADFETLAASPRMF